MGVAPAALASVMNRRKYQPYVWTTSCRFARLQPGLDGVPLPSREVRPAAPAAQGAIDEVDLRGVEEVGQGLAPSPLPVRTISPAVADGGVADQEERGKLAAAGDGIGGRGVGLARVSWP
jgi:hypothetical protein